MSVQKQYAYFSTRDIIFSKRINLQFRISYNFLFIQFAKIVNKNKISYKYNIFEIDKIEWELFYYSI